MLSEIKSHLAGKASFFISIFFIGLISAGCSTTTYLNLTENDKETVRRELNVYEKGDNVGAEVTIVLINEKEVEGELLSVRDSALILCTECDATEEELANSVYPVILIKNNEITELTIEGSNYVWIGLSIGIAIGAGMGAIAGSAESSDYWRPLATTVLMVLGSIAGAIIGPIVGYLLSTDDVILQEIPPCYNFSFLKPLARYPDKEPEYLKLIK